MSILPQEQEILRDYAGKSISLNVYQGMGYQATKRRKYKKRRLDYTVEYFYLAFVPLNGLLQVAKFENSGCKAGFLSQTLVRIKRITYYLCW